MHLRKRRSTKPYRVDTHARFVIGSLRFDHPVEGRVRNTRTRFTRVYRDSVPIRVAPSRLPSFYQTTWLRHRYTRGLDCGVLKVRNGTFACYLIKSFGWWT
jgi:hypothetical protein